MSGLRGSRSSGIASCTNTKGKNFDWVKMTSHPFDLIELKRFGTATSAPRRLLLGHTRAPTVGEVSNANTQPFMFKHTVGCHNGTLNLSAQRRLPGNERFETDSEALINSLDKRGPAETVKDIEGAWALVWFDIRAGELRMLRNDQRPLWYCYNKDRSCLFWASEPDMLRLCLNRDYRGILGDGEIFPVSVDTMLSWEIPSGQKKFAPPQKTEGMIGHHTPVVPYTHHRQFTAATGGAWKDDDLPFEATGPINATTGEPYRAQIRNGVYQVWDPKTRTFKPKDITDVLVTKAADYKKKHFLHDGARVKFYKGWNGEALDREAYIEKTKDGCAWCTGQADWPEHGQPDIIRFINANDHFCWGCMSSPEAADAVGLINKDKTN